MEIDASFNWQLTDRTDSNGPEGNALLRDHDDCDITQRNSILRLVNPPSPPIEEDLDFDPYNTGYVET